MPGPLLTRRSFLAATGGLIVVAACGSNGGSNGEAGGEEDHHAPIPQGAGLSALLLSGDVYASPMPQRFIFALAEDGEYTSGAPASITFAPNGGTAGERLTTTLYERGLPDGRGIYAVEATFGEAGVWVGIVEVDGKTAEVAVQVRPEPATLAVGQPAVRAASPTLADPMGVEPLCSREPDCPLHVRSLDQLIGAGRPVIALFATPARCSSQYCGPVLDEMLTLVGDYQDRVDFVHVEIYQAETGIETVSTVQAWNLPSEPWLFAIDGNGTVTGRLDGAFGGEEIQTLVDSLAA